MHTIAMPRVRTHTIARIGELRFGFLLLIGKSEGTDLEDRIQQYAGAGVGVPCVCYCNHGADHAALGAGSQGTLLGTVAGPLLGLPTVPLRHASAVDLLGFAMESHGCSVYKLKLS